jgi:hypothetical protein
MSFFLLRILSIILIIFQVIWVVNAKNGVSQEYRIIHPYRQLDIGTSTSDGYAVKDTIMYLATLFDGHIYEFNLKTRKISDRFRIHELDINQNSPGGMIYVKETNQLYAGTGKSFTGVPNIYIFDTEKDTLPNKILHIDTLGIYSFFSPIQIDSYLYWGCYHTQAGGNPKIIKINILDNRWEVKEFSSTDRPIQANYTFSLEKVGDILYVSTETGHILKFDIRSDQFLERTINLTKYGARYIPHLVTDGRGLWAMTSLNSLPLFYINQPDKRRPKIYQVPERMSVIFSRIFLLNDSFLYGQGYRIRYARRGEFEYEDLPYLNYEYMRDFMGTFTLDGRNYILGENRYAKDNDVSRREFRISQLPPISNPEIINFPDIRSQNTGAILLTMGSDKVSKLYMSTYLIGLLYSIDSSLESLPHFLTNNRNVKFNEQADVILPYPAASGSMLFGCYKGSSGSAVLYYFNPSLPKGQQWTMKSLPETECIIYPRITSIAFDLSNNLYLGTGEMTVSATTVPAAIFFLNKSSLESRQDTQIQKKIRYSWPDDSDVDRPIRIMAIVHDRNYLYCMSYHSVPNGIKSKFFRINTRNQKVEISNQHDGAFVGIRNKMIYKDRKYLIVAFSSRLYKYDLENFSFDAPLNVLELEEFESIKSIVGDEQYYYLAMDRKILMLDHQFREIRSFYPMSKGDVINEIDIIGRSLYAITKNGLLIKYNLDD